MGPVSWKQILMTVSIGSWMLPRRHSSCFISHGFPVFHSKTVLIKNGRNDAARTRTPSEFYPAHFDMLTFLESRYIEPKRWLRRPIMFSGLDKSGLVDKRSNDSVCESNESGSVGPDDNYFCPILKDLNHNQVQAVTQPLSSITRVVAGPGSGKTRVLTSRIAYLLQEDRRNRILAVTFTRKAAGEMQQRLENLLHKKQQQEQHGDFDNEYSNKWDDKGNEAISTHAELGRVSLGTFHSICAKILRWNGDRLASLPSVIDDMSKSSNKIVLDASFNIIDQADQVRIIRQCLSARNIDLKVLDLKPIDILNGIGRVKAAFAQGKDPFDNKQTEKQISQLQKIVNEVFYPYRDTVLSANCVDFDDLIYLTRELLLVNPDIRERLQHRWTHILVDEFQDTSQSQLDLIKLLTSSSLLVVGDADQSIYSWRGAHAGSMVEFEKDFQEFHCEGVSTIHLMENYRSTSNIVKAAQKIISTSGKESGNQKLRQNMIPKRSAGQNLRIIAFENGKAEADFIAQQLKKKVQRGELGPHQSVGIIYRTNAQSRALEEACVLHNIPYLIFGTSTSFYKRQEIKDCLCFLRWLYNGRDRSSMLRAMTTPKRGIGDTAIREFDEYCTLVVDLWEEKSPSITKPTPLEILFHISGDDSWCYWADAEFPPPTIALSVRSLKPLVSFSHQMQTIRDKAYLATVEQVLSLIIDEMDLISHFDKISKSKAELEDRLENIQELQQVAGRYNNNGPCMIKNMVKPENGEFPSSPLENFLDGITLVTDMVDDAESSSEDRFVANLMTIHASKGMEFDIVYFVGVEEGTIPTNQALEQGEGSVLFEEEKRLCYVAMTRAKTQLVLTWRREIPVFTTSGIKTVTKKRSRFLNVLVKPEERQLKHNSRPYPTNRIAIDSDVVNKPRKSSSQMPTNFIKMYKPTSLAPSEVLWSRHCTAITNQDGFPKYSGTSKQFQGTASVYLKQALSSEDHDDVFVKKKKFTPSMRTSRYAAIAPRNTNIYSKPRGEILSRQAPSTKETLEPNLNLHKIVASSSVSRSATNSLIKQTGSVLPEVDSTWFYPVGSTVMHKQFGKGVILNPKPNTNSKIKLVLVQFPNGEKKEFPLNEADLSPIV